MERFGVIHDPYLEGLALKIYPLKCTSQRLLFIIMIHYDEIDNDLRIANLCHYVSLDFQISGGNEVV
jgi:hypothetical protein